MPRARGRERIGERGGAIRPDPEIADGAAKALQQRHQHDPVGVIDHAGRERLAGLAHLVAGRQQGHPQLPEHRQPVIAERGGESEIGRLEPPPGRERDRAFGDILAGMAAIGPLLDPRREPHPALFDDAILLHHHGIDAVRHRRAGKDADRLARTRGMAERVPGGGAPGHRQHRVLVGQQIGMGDRITVDRAVGMRRHIDRRHQIMGENPAARLGERRHLLGNDRLYPLLDQSERRIDTEQLAAKGKAILAQLRHHASPK